MNFKPALLVLSTLLLAACASEPETAATSPKHGAWVDQFHEPRGRTECLVVGHNNEADPDFQRCIRGWHERIWVEDLTAPGDKAP